MAATTAAILSEPFSLARPFGWEVFKLKYLENPLSEFHEIFQDCSPRRAGPGDVFIFPAAQLGEGLGAPKLGGNPPKISHFLFPGVQIFTTISSAR